MRKEEVVFLENRQIINKLKQSWALLTDLRNQCNQLQAKLNQNPYQSLEEIRRRLSAKKHKLRKEITCLKREVESNDSPIPEHEESNAKLVYQLHKELEQRKSQNIQKRRELDSSLSKIDSSKQTAQTHTKRLQEVNLKFKPIEVCLGNQKAKQNYQILQEKKTKHFKILQKKSSLREEEYNRKIQEFDGYVERIDQYQRKEKEAQGRIDALAAIIAQLRSQSRTKIRIKTERATTESSVQNYSVKKIYKRYSSLQPAKDQNEVNEFLEPWQSSKSILVQKQFQVRQLNKRSMGQKIRVFLNN